MTRARQIHGVLGVRVDALDDRLVVLYDPSLTDEKKVASAVGEIVDSVDR